MRLKHIKKETTLPKVVKAANQDISRRRLALAKLTLPVVLTLNGCGFRLRGVVNLNFSSLHIKTAGPSELPTEIQRLLRSNGIQILALAKEADMVLEIISEQRSQGILSFTSAGIAREIELVYKVTYRIGQEKNLSSNTAQTLGFRRELINAEGFALANELEQNLLYREMQSDAAQQIIRQLEFLSLPNGGIRK